VPGIVESTAYFTQAVLDQGVEAIVNMSQISARRDATSHASQNHWIAERVFDRSGIADFESILRTAMRASDYFAQHILAVAQDCRNGLFSGTNSNVEDIMGQKPMSMTKFIEKNKAILI